METILTANLWTKDNKSKVVINGKYFLPAGMVKNQTGISTNHQILIGSNISVDFYKVGEAITDDMNCTKDDCIVKAFTIELAPMLQQYASAAAFGTVVSFK